MPFTAGRFAITVLGTFILIAGMIVIGIADISNNKTPSPIRRPQIPQRVDPKDVYKRQS